MLRGNIIPFISACSVGIGAYLGSKYERYTNQQTFVRSSGVESDSYFPWTLHASTITNVQPKPNLGSALSSNSSMIMKFGFPSLENVRVFDDFVLAYDKRNRNANWVFEHLAPDKLPSKASADRSRSNFFEDKDIHEKFRSYLADYKYSGYDRGHLAAAGNHRHSQHAMDQTFTLSNISPQVGEGFNRGIWNKLEQYIRGIARKNRNTYVCTGPLYLPRREADGKMYVRYEVIGKNNVAVPTHFFKVVAIETHNGDFEILSFVLPNKPMKDDVPFKSFFTPLDAVERASGLLILNKIPLNKVKLINHEKPR